MPGFNRKGPNGEGPRTGRQMGKCNAGNSNNSEEIMEKRKQRRGMGKGAGNHFGGNKA